MPRPIKYTTSKGNRSMRKKKVEARVGKGNIGPSTATGYYNCVSPTTPGLYVVYYVTSNKPPLSYAPQSDEEFIRLAISIFGYGYGIVTVQDALDAFSINDSYLVTSLVNTTGSLDINPFCIYDSLGTNPSSTQKWYNSVAPYDNMGIDNKEHALSEWICMVGGTARYAAPYTGTIIYEIDTNENITTKVSATSSPTSGNISITSGRRYVANKPIHLAVQALQHAIIPISYYGDQFGYYFNRYEPSTLHIYGLIDNTEIRIFRNGVANANLTSTVSVSKNQVVTHTFNAVDDDNQYQYIISNNPIVMTGTGTSGDRMYAPLAGELIYQRRNGYSKTMEGGGTIGTTYARYDSSGTPVWGMAIADGSGGDSESSIPSDLISKNYTFGSNLSDFHITSPHSTNDIKVSSWDGSSWTLHETIRVTGGTSTSPVHVCRDGSQGWGNPCTSISGGASYFNSNTLWKWEGDYEFAIWVNDASNDEEMLLGWNSGNVESFFI